MYFDFFLLKDQPAGEGKDKEGKQGIDSQLFWNNNHVFCLLVSNTWHVAMS